MTSGAELVPSCAFREQPLAHHAQHPRPGDSDPVEDPQPRVLAMAPWNGERARSVRIRQQSDSSARGAPGHHPALGAANKPAARRARARPIPRSTHPLETIAPPRRRGGRSAHRRDKGRRHSAARARSRNSSISIDSSRGAWRHPARRPAAPAPSDRLETGQRPRLPRLQAIELYPDFTRDHLQRLAASSRNTTSRFRLALHRWPGAKAPAPTAAPSAPTPLALRAPSVRADPAPCTRLD